MCVSLSFFLSFCLLLSLLFDYLKRLEMPVFERKREEDGEGGREGGRERERERERESGERVGS